MQKYIGREALLERYDHIAYVTAWRWMRKGLLPKPHKRDGKNLWSIAELDEYDNEFERDARVQYKD